jgi:hypothetical protein
MDHATNNEDANDVGILRCRRITSMNQKLSKCSLLHAMYA